MLNLKNKIQTQIIENLTLALQDFVDVHDGRVVMSEDRLFNQADDALNKAKLTKLFLEGKAELSIFKNQVVMEKFIFNLEQREHEALKIKDQWFVFSRPVGFTQLNMFKGILP